MTRLFIETSHHAAFRYGGWGVARDQAGMVTGKAGGERNTTAARIDLLALIAALEGAPPGPASVHSASPGVLNATRLLAVPPAAEAAPTENLDLWAALRGAATGRVLTLGPAAAGPTSFLNAWAEVGREKAKGQGRFAAAIPKPNLAKLILP